MANFGLSENQMILEELCRICVERLKKAKDKYENSFFSADRREVIFMAFGASVTSLLQEEARVLQWNIWRPHKRRGNCVICSSYKDQ